MKIHELEKVIVDVRAGHLTKATQNILLEKLEKTLETAKQTQEYVNTL